MEYNEILMEKINNLNTKVDDFVKTAHMNFEVINKSVNEVKQELGQVHTQAILTNSRVNKLEGRADSIDKIQANCPAKVVQDSFEVLREDMTVWIFIGKYWKVVLPAAATFIGIIIGAYSAILALVGS